jgi:hypothetical protein
MASVSRASLPTAVIMTLRAFDARGLGAESDVARALAYAVANGVRVINMSFGDVVYSRVLRDVIRWAYARGVVMVASAGNSQSSALHYPSAYDETISVSRTTSGDVLAGFSNYGSRPSTSPRRVRTYSPRTATGATPHSTAPPHRRRFVTAAAALLLSPQRQIVAGGSSRHTRRLGGGSRYAGAGTSASGPACCGWIARCASNILPSCASRRRAPMRQQCLEHCSTAAPPPRRDVADTKCSTAWASIRSRWTDIIGNISRQIVDDSLCVWNISALPDTTYTLRLAALSDKGVSLDDRIVVHIDRTPPRFLGALLVPALDGAAYGIAWVLPRTSRRWARSGTERGVHPHRGPMGVRGGCDAQQSLHRAGRTRIFLGPESVFARKGL